MVAQVKVKLVDHNLLGEFYFRPDQKVTAQEFLAEGKYTIVCEFATEYHDDEAAEFVFDLTNNPSRQDQREQVYGRRRSLSVGDIVEVDGVNWLCQSSGWTKV